MGRFNLLDEPWISVLVERTGEKKDVSMVEFFRNASDYYSLAGEMETQNFAVMRFLLSVIHTVFSRFDYDGNVLPGVSLDERWIQTEDVDEDDWEEYDEAVSECWKRLYLTGIFPEVLFNYLEKWRNRFYLFDEKFPIFQVNKKEMDEILVKISEDDPTFIYGRNINRTISESENKIALFSPIKNTEIAMKRKKPRKKKDGTKDILTEAELARWLVMFHGYTGQGEKKRLAKKSSNGWLYDLGGIFLRGGNIFETLVINYIPGSPDDNQNFIGRIQKPCWEVSGREVIDRLCRERFIDNLAELYTNWSRAIHINADTNMSKPLELGVIKLPAIEHTEISIEPMTLWEWKDKEKCFYPKKHNVEESLWRHFGIITIKETNDEKIHRSPGILKQYKRLKDVAGNRWTDIVGVSMESGDNKASQEPVGEVTDSFQINDLVITDTDYNGWVIRISDAVETTKEIISKIFNRYLEGICEIRNLELTKPNANGFVSEEIKKMYSIIDSAFKEWLASIKPSDSKEAKIIEWYSQLRKMVLNRVEELFECSTVRDLTGIKNKKGIENIAVKYWEFVNTINKKLVKGGKP